MTILTYPKFQAPDINGVNLSGGLVYFYETGNSVLKNTYSDEALTIVNSNPVILNARGEADIYLSGIYKIILKTADDVEIWSIDPFSGMNLSSSVEIDTTNESAMIFAGPTIWKETALADLKWDDTNKRFSIGVDDSLEKAHIQDGNILVTPGTNAVQGTSSIKGFLTELTDLNGITEVFVLGNYVYTANINDDSMRIIDISDPANPEIVGGLKEATDMNGIRDVVCDGHYVYAACSLDNSLRIIDVSDPANPTAAGFVKDNTDLAGIRKLYLSGHYIYAACYTDNSLRVIDISDPTAPEIYGPGLKDDTNLDNISGVYVMGGYAYVTCWQVNTMQIVDISDPLSLTIAGGLSDNVNLMFPTGIFVLGTQAYITASDNNGDGSLQIIDVSDPTTPVRLGGIVMGIGEAVVGKVVVADNYAYVSADISDAFWTIDISDPVTPVIVSTLVNSLVNGSQGLALVGKYVYVAAEYSDSLLIIDISGIKAPAASIGSLAATILNVAANALIGNNLVVGGGVNIGRDVNIGGSLNVSKSPSFSVNRNGSAQTNITSIDKVEFNNEDFDTNSNFDSATNYRFTPTVSGKYLLTASISWSSVTSGDFLVIYLYKNGSSYKKVADGSGSTGGSTFITVLVDANGSTDYFEIFAENEQRNTSSLSGSTVLTFFTGCRII